MSRVDGSREMHSFISFTHEMSHSSHGDRTTEEEYLRTKKRHSSFRPAVDSA